MSSAGFLRLPSGLDFEVWGLADNFTGERHIGLWDVDSSEPTLRETAPVYRVTTDHLDTTGRVFVSVHTVPKRPRSNGFGEYGFREAAGGALHHAIDKAAWCEPGVEAALDVLEVIRPGDSPDDPQWGRRSLIVGGGEHEGRFLRVGQAWVAVVNLPVAVIGVSGCGAEPDAYGLVPIADLSRYHSQRWPREERHPSA